MGKVRTARKEEHEKVPKTIMDDDFLDKIEVHIKFPKSCTPMIKFANSDKATIEAYERTDMMPRSIKKALIDNPFFYQVVHDMVVNMWDKFNIPLYCIGHVPIPKYYPKVDWSFLCQKVKNDASQMLIMKFRKVTSILSND